MRVYTRLTYSAIRVEYRGGGALVWNTIRFTVSPLWGPTLAGGIYPDPGGCRWRVEYRLGTLYRATLPLRGMLCNFQSFFFLIEKFVLYRFLRPGEICFPLCRLARSNTSCAHGPARQEDLTCPWEHGPANSPLFCRVQRDCVCIMQGGLRQLHPCDSSIP